MLLDSALRASLVCELELADDVAVEDVVAAEVVAKGDVVCVVVDVMLMTLLFPDRLFGYAVMSRAPLIQRVRVDCGKAVSISASLPR